MKSVLNDTVVLQVMIALASRGTSKEASHVIAMTILCEEALEENGQ